jgi:hypothetical protein
MYLGTRRHAKTRKHEGENPSTQKQYSETGRRAVTPLEGLNQSKSHRVHPWDWSYIVAFLLILIQLSDDQTSTEAC